MKIGDTITCISETSMAIPKGTKGIVTDIKVINEKRVRLEVNYGNNLSTSGAFLGPEWWMELNEVKFDR